MSGQDSLNHIALWKLLREKMEEEGLPSEFEAGVKEIWKYGLNLSKTIIRFFPTFTLHDETHIENVCDWMNKLLGDKRNNLKAVEVALLLLAASCHDIGMSVSVQQEQELASNGETWEWREFFRTNPKDGAEFQKTGDLSDRMLRSFVRVNHHKRVAEQLNSKLWPSGLSQEGLDRETLIRLCQSHGEPLDHLRDSGYEEYDLGLCAVLLRLADILDFDASRAPEDLYHHLGLDHPTTAEAARSTTEWDKHCTSPHFAPVKDGVLPFSATCTNMQVEHDVRAYLSWVQKELDSCSQCLTRTGRTGKIQLPYKVSVNIKATGYHSGEFCLTMDQDRILELLTGRNLYSDSGVFVRELLQNAIDAVHTRSKLDPRFKIEDGRIVIRTWVDGEGKSWFRIEDNGTGMDEHIITNYFLKVGRSYYESDDFKADMRSYGDGQTYTPLSRFGIGILSCFMSDPDHTLLEVSTKRFSQDPMRGNPGIRMNVTGLHGYYYLAKEGEQETGGGFQPMHHPQNADNGYRREPGTTICVCMDLYRLGHYRSFKEIVDKYVQFPEVIVEYKGQEGAVTYPTQKELMDVVHRLNPDGPNKPIKEHIYQISDESFELIKKIGYKIEWKEKPAVIFKYVPLDWISSGDIISGFALSARFETYGAEFYSNINGNEYKVKVKYEINDRSTGRQICFDNYDSMLNAIRLYDIEISDSMIYINLDYCEENSSDDSALFNMIRFENVYLRSGTYPSVLTSKGGVMIDNEYAYEDGKQIALVLLIFQGDYCPELDLSRQTIRTLDLEAICALIFIQHALGVEIISATLRKKLNMTTESEWYKIFDKHKDWEERIIKEGGIINNFIYAERDNSFCIAKVAAIKYSYSVYFNYKSRGQLCITNKSSDKGTAAFPATMFFDSEEGDDHLGQISYSTINCYNKHHTFSCWLIQHQGSLEELVPAYYYELLEIMVLETDRFKILRGVNAILTRLQGYQNNRFEISDSLFLQDRDLT